MPPQDTLDTYSHLVSWMAKNFSNMAYLHVVEARVSGVNDVEPEQENTDFLYDIWTPRNYIVAGGYTAATALAVADSKVNALVAIGRYFISNV